MTQDAELREVVQFLLDRSGAHDLLIGVLANLVVGTGVLTEAELTELIHSIDLTNDTPGCIEARHLIALMVNGQPHLKAEPPAVRGRALG